MSAIRPSQILLLLMTTWSAITQADWAKVGAALQCSADGSSFILAPVVETSESSYDVHPPAGAQLLKAGVSQNFECKVGTDSISLTLTVFDPQARGMGQGAGGVIISKFTVGGREIISKPTNFNWSVQGERALMKIEVVRDGAHSNTSTCIANAWSWGPYSDIQCARAGVR